MQFISIIIISAVISFGSLGYASEVAETNYNSLLLESAMACNIDGLKRALENSANVNTQDSNGNTALHLLILSKTEIQNFIKALRILLQYRASLEIRNLQTFSPIELFIYLHERKIEGHKKLLPFIEHDLPHLFFTFGAFEEREKINIITRVLHLPVEKGKLIADIFLGNTKNILESLSSKKVVSKIEHHTGKPITIFSLFSIILIAMLYRAGPDYLLNLAYAQPAIFCILGLGLNIAYVMLKALAKDDLISIVGILIERQQIDQEYLNVRDIHGMSSLMWATRLKNSEVVKALLKYAADNNEFLDCSLTNVLGETVICIAQRHNPEVLGEIEKYINVPEIMAYLEINVPKPLAKIIIAYLFNQIKIEDNEKTETVNHKCDNCSPALATVSPDRSPDIVKHISKARSCANCSQENCEQRCSQCKLVYYCSTECQKEHWAKHKLECVGPLD